MGIWESLDVCQGDLLYRVINWMLYGNVSIQGRCDLGVVWGMVKWGFCLEIIREFCGDWWGAWVDWYN